jgi:monofunctional biosynthetic peptidoglycan transglycosylase
MRKKRARGGVLLRGILGLFFFALALALVPAVQVAVLRWVPPLTTGTMVQRWVEAAVAGERRPPVVVAWTPAGSIPRSLFQFAWVSEDQRFFAHQGFDWVEMRQAWEEAQADGVAPRGASTITMQTARTVFLWQGRSWLRKALEAYYTVWMEQLLPKARIFELYLNTAEMGPGVYGVAAAASYHFGTSPARLNREQQAMLVALLPNPRHWNPHHPPPVLRSRQQRILRRAEQAEFPAELDRLGARR